MYVFMYCLLFSLSAGHQLLSENYFMATYLRMVVLGVATFQVSFPDNQFLLDKINDEDEFCPLLELSYSYHLQCFLVLISTPVSSHQEQYVELQNEIKVIRLLNCFLFFQSQLMLWQSRAAIFRQSAWYVNIQSSINYQSLSFNFRLFELLGCIFFRTP